MYSKPSKTAQLIVNGLGYILVGALKLYEFGENITRQANHKIEQTVSYSAGREQDKR